MANRIIEATLYQGTYKETNRKAATAYMLNVSPRNFIANGGDQVFLTVNLDSSAASGGGSISGKIIWNNGSINPFSKTFALPTALNTPTLIGILKKVKPGSSDKAEYTLSITYNDNTYSEDPEMRLKGE